MNEGENKQPGDYLKCTCKECGNHIEFPASSARDTVSCPHCGEWTELVAPGEPGEKKVSLNLAALAVWILLPVALLAGLAFFVHYKISLAENKTAPPPIVKVPAPPVIKAAPTPTNPAPVITSNAAPQTPTTPRPKSFADLKAGDVTIQKPKEGNLTYAVGMVKNDSDYQRFGVRIEVDLISLQGSKLGTSKDYISILEPHKEWHFHALVTEPKGVVAARVALLKEE